LPPWIGFEFHFPPTPGRNSPPAQARFIAPPQSQNRQQRIVFNGIVLLSSLLRASFLETARRAFLDHFSPPCNQRLRSPALKPVRVLHLSKVSLLTAGSNYAGLVRQGWTVCDQPSPWPDAIGALVASKQLVFPVLHGSRNCIAKANKLRALVALCLFFVSCLQIIPFFGKGMNRFALKENNCEI